MRDPENPNEGPNENIPQNGNGAIRLKSREDNLLWTLRNSIETLNRYGIGRKDGKYFVQDKELLERIFTRQPELREVLRKLWTKI